MMYALNPLPHLTPISLLQPAHIEAIFLRSIVTIPTLMVNLTLVSLLQPAHIKAMFLGSNVTVPITDGKFNSRFFVTATSYKSHVSWQ